MIRVRRLSDAQVTALLLIECAAMASGDMQTRRLCALALTYGCADSISELLDIHA